MEAKELQLNLNAEFDKRKGSYSNFQTVTDLGKESILDFFFVDQTGVDESGKTFKNGVMVSRIILSRNGLVELKDMLVKHIEKMDYKDDEEL